MKAIIPFILACSFFVSCTDDISTVSITYTKASGVYADLTEIRQTALAGAPREITNPGKIFVSQNMLLIGEEGVGVHVLDNSNPEDPTNVLFINIPGNREFYVQDNSLYAESYYDMLKIDISNIQQPVLISRAENAFSSDFTNDQGQPLIGFTFEEVTENYSGETDVYSLIQPNEINYFDHQERLIPESAVPASFAGNSQQGIGSVNRIAFYNDHVYVISRSFLSTFSDSGTLDHISTESLSWQMETIYPYENKLFIGTQGSMEIVDITNPATPTSITTFFHANACDPVFPIDNVAYVTLRAGDDTETNCPGTVNALLVIDIEQIDSPFQVDEIPMQSPFGMTMIGERLYVGEGKNGLKIFNASDKLNLQLESFDTSIEAYDVIGHPTRNDVVLVTGPEGLNQYEIAEENRQLLSNIPF